MGVHLFLWFVKHIVRSLLEAVLRGGDSILKSTTTPLIDMLCYHHQLLHSFLHCGRWAWVKGIPIVDHKNMFHSCGVCRARRSLKVPRLFCFEILRGKNRKKNVRGGPQQNSGGVATFSAIIIIYHWHGKALWLAKIEIAIIVTQKFHIFYKTIFRPVF